MMTTKWSNKSSEREQNKLAAMSEEFIKNESFLCFNIFLIFKISLILLRNIC